MRGQPFVTADFKDGVNKQLAPYSITSTQAQDTLNITSTNLGAVKRRGGFRPLISRLRTDEATYDGPILSLFPYESGTTKRILALTDDMAFSVNTGGGVGGVKGSAVISPGHRWCAVQAPSTGDEGPLYLVNGVDPPLYWNGTDNLASWTAASGTIPNGKFMIYHDNRVMVAGVDTNATTRSTLYSSSIADPRTWASPDGATNIFDPEDGESISGLGTVGPYPLVFKPTKTFVVTDSDSLAYRNISDEKGCVAHHSIVNSDTGTFFLTADRTICVTDGSTINHISEAVDPILRDIAPGALMNASGCYHDGKYYLSVARGSLTNDMILEFDIRNASWWIHKVQLAETITHGINDWCVLDPQGAAKLYAAGSNETHPRIYEAFSRGRYIDDVRFRSYWATGWETFGAPHLRKIISGVRADHRGDVTMSWATSFSSFGGDSADDRILWETSSLDETSFGNEGDFGGDGTFGGGSGVSETRWYTLGTARNWAFRFENNQPEDWELYSYTVGVEQRED